MTPPYRTQDPNETQDWTLDYQLEMDAVGSPSDAIASSTWTIEGGGSPTPVLSGQVDTADTTTIFVSGVEFSEVYLLRNRVTTNNGRTYQRSITIRGEHR